MDKLQIDQGPAQHLPTNEQPLPEGAMPTLDRPGVVNNSPFYHHPNSLISQPSQNEMS